MLPRLFVLEATAAAAAAAAAARYQMSRAGGREERGDLICVRAENASLLSFPFPPTQREEGRGNLGRILHFSIRQKEVGKYVKMFLSLAAPSPQKNTFLLCGERQSYGRGGGVMDKVTLKTFIPAPFSLLSSFLLLLFLPSSPHFLSGRLKIFLSSHHRRSKKVHKDFQPRTFQFP